MPEHPHIGAKLKANFSISSHGIKVALFVVGAVMTMFACIGIAAAWSQLDTVSRWLNVISVIQQGLSTIIEATALILDVAEITEGVAATAPTVCARGGPILAIIGLAIMVAMLIWEAHQPPPLSPIEVWIRDIGRGVVDLLSDPPSPKLSWTVTSPLPAKQANITCSVTGTNTTSSNIVLYSVTTNFFSGTSPSALFVDNPFYAKPDIQPTLQTGQAMYVSLPNGSITNAEFTIVPAGSQTGSDGKMQTQYNIGVSAGALANPQVIVVPPGSEMVVSLMGTVRASGSCEIILRKIGLMRMVCRGKVLMLNPLQSSSEGRAPVCSNDGFRAWDSVWLFLCLYLGNFYVLTLSLIPVFNLF